MCFNHRAIATFIEVLAFLYWFFNTLQKYIYLQNSRCVLFWNHFFFFHNDALPSPPPKRPRKTILYKGRKWKLWKVRYENVFQNTVASAITRPLTNYKKKNKNANVHERLIKLMWGTGGEEEFPHKVLCSPAEGSSFRIFFFFLLFFFFFLKSLCFTSAWDSFTQPTTGNSFFKK